MLGDQSPGSRVAHPSAAFDRDKTASRDFFSYPGKPTFAKSARCDAVLPISGICSYLSCPLTFSAASQSIARDENVAWGILMTFIAMRPAMMRPAFCNHVFHVFLMRPQP
jgi:hypothetical protein